MACPLYAEAEKKTGNRPTGGNLSLWFDKFCNTWNREQGSWSLSSDKKGRNPKFEWLNKVAGKTGNDAQIAEHVSRLADLVRQRGGRLMVFRTESRFVTGLGRSHPVENGFAWHLTLGTPYLAGSSVKGLVHAWAKQVESDQKRIERLFGHRDCSGLLAFLDAVPAEPPELAVDVMTPHYAGWSETDPPGDWRSPTPIPFLTTHAGARFVFSVLPLRDASKDDLDLAVDWLEKALAQAGAGAKTAVGYGRMSRDSEAEKKLMQRLEEIRQLREKERQEQQRLAQMDPLDRELQEIAQQPGYKDQPPFHAWRKELVAGRWRDDEAQQRRVAERIRDEMVARKMWRPEDKKYNKKMAKHHEWTLQVMKYLPDEPGS